MVCILIDILIKRRHNKALKLTCIVKSKHLRTFNQRFNEFRNI
jgi:hypothetical protein